MNAEMTGEDLKKIRQSLGYTQKQLAERIGVTPQAVRQWEWGLRRIHPPIANLVKTFLTNDNGARGTGKPKTKAASVKSARKKDRR